MLRKYMILLCLLFLLPCAAQASEDAYLSPDDLHALSPAYETFLDELADLLVQRGLLSQAEREEWLLYQLGDYLQNGGYGSIAVLYTPGLLSIADASVMLRRISYETGEGVLYLETLNRYSPASSTLPGLPLDVQYYDVDDTLTACRYRWVTSYGSLYIWDGMEGDIVNVGATYVNNGKPLYWFAEPVDGIAETLALEVLHPTEDRTLLTVTLTVRSGDNFWSPEGFL